MPSLGDPCAQIPPSYDARVFALTRGSSECILLEDVLRSTMITISLGAVWAVGKFLGVWGLSYLVLVVLRFGSMLTWRSELVAATIALLVPVIAFTDIFKFVW